MNKYDMSCYFCGGINIRLPFVGISLSMAGGNYSFCENCLDGMTADQFWEMFFSKNEYNYPPKLADWAQNALNEGRHPNEEIYPANNKKIEGSKKVKKPKGIKERSKMTNSLRYKIMRRDNFTCVLCGATGKDDILVVDHINPVSKGGKTEVSNLRTLCQTCNSGKKDRIEPQKHRKF